jgi:Zn-dependent protease with chaperone function
MRFSRITSYRYPTEEGILFITCTAILLVILLTVDLTFRISLILISGSLLVVYLSSRVKHAELLRKALLVNDRSAPALTVLARECIEKMGCGPIQLFIMRSPALNAYTFGLSDPKVIVVYSALLQEMDADEIRFILGHEVGHICLGHTWLNSIIGGMAGLPSTFLGTTLLRGIFLWWNRACEYSADRAGLLVCGRLDKALSALIKLAAGPGDIRNPADVQRILRLVEEEEADPVSALKEIMATHPIIARRMKVLRSYAASSQYRHLQDRIDQRVSKIS